MMKNVEKYKPFQPIPITNRTWPTKTITKAPTWVSVDLRDGNQALINPMGVEQKLEFFDLLVKLGFKEIEVGFPSASDTEFNFMRRLIEENHVPEDVTLQVLCQAREHLVIRTFEALKGVKKAIFHIYNSPSRYATAFHPVRFTVHCQFAGYDRFLNHTKKPIYILYHMKIGAYSDITWNIRS